MSSHNNSNVGVKREDKGRNIQVVVRCRPVNSLEKARPGCLECDQNRKEVIVKTGASVDKTSRKTYTFDMVFGPAAKQIEVYRSVVCPILDEVIMGYNCTVFAYGQTGTGKTFTMEGERSPNGEFTWEEDPLAGVIPRTLHQIFEKLSSNGTEFSVKVSLLEIYNEELFDLLSTGDEIGERLQLFDDPRNKRGVVIKGLEEVTVHNKNEVYQILERGAAKRKTASTLMNAYSSRSHSVFSVTIHMKEITLEGEELVKIGKLNLVDLAGSENIGRSGAVDKRAREAGNINQSLLTLGRVITALVEKRPHVPYRESKLTRILQDSLGGRTKTSVIATVSPSSINLEETLSTLEYASRAKNIMNKPEVNQKLTKRTLIKEYTEEIERLKRDLAASRDKNGVFLSPENYENMSGQLASQEAQITEYTERIAAMEEELKTVLELFEDNRGKLQQCTQELGDKQQRLEDANRDLQETKEKLTEEEFICSELATTQETLYNTAHKLLSTVDASTGDVSGLHAKLDRKKQVEQHNSQIQMSFNRRIEESFSAMQHCVQQQGTKHHNMLTGFTQAIDGVLAVNETAFKQTLSTVETSLGGVRQLLAEGVSLSQADAQQQEALCLSNKTSLVQQLEERNKDMEELLSHQVLPCLSAVQTMLTDGLQEVEESKRAVAEQMNTMKQMSVFFSGVVQDLAAIRETTSMGISSLLAQVDRLNEQIRQASENQETNMNQLIQCMQNQLSLVALKNKKDYSDLSSTAQGLTQPFETVQQTFNTGCGKMESQIAAQSDVLSSTASSLATSFHQTAQTTQTVLKKSVDSCSQLHGSLTGLREQNTDWFSRSKEQVEACTQEQVTMLRKSVAAAHTLQQNVELLCAEQMQRTNADLTERQEEVITAVGSVQNQVSLDHTLLDKQQAELQNYMESGLEDVHRFLQEELQQDVPTGLTPQRRDFAYPRVLVKSRRRSELLEDLRGQQRELQAALADSDDVVVVEEEKTEVDQDSLEDEMSSNETSSKDLFSIDENLVCNESERVPFFKQKKAGKKENKTNPNKSKVSENDAATPQRSRLPLRCQN